LGEATEVIIGGDSAGGLAAYMHVDTMANMIRQAGSKASVLAMPDSGFWADGQQWGGTFRKMLALQNGTAGLNLACRKAFPNNVNKCLFPVHFANLIHTPIFPVQGIYDPDQRGNPGGLAVRGPEMLQQMSSTIFAKPRNGGWIHSCQRHCGGTTLTIDGDTFDVAVRKFQNGKKKLWLQNKTYPCTSCCNDGGADLLTVNDAGIAEPADLLTV